MAKKMLLLEKNKLGSPALGTPQSEAPPAGMPARRAPGTTCLCTFLSLLAWQIT